MSRFYNPSSKEKEYSFKVIVIGDVSVGKTSIINRYVHKTFQRSYHSTIGVDFALKMIHLNDDLIVKLQLWDISGQERFGNMTRVYYREAVGAFIVFDVTRASTFEAVNKWKNDLDQKLQLPNGKVIPAILLGNKCDVLNDGLSNNREQMDRYCKEKGFAGWFETSAKENKNLDDAVHFLIKLMLKNSKKLLPIDGDTEQLILPTTPIQERKCCFN